MQKIIIYYIYTYLCIIHHYTSLYFSWTTWMKSIISPKVAKCLWDAQAFHFLVFYHHYSRRNTTISCHWIVSLTNMVPTKYDLPKPLAYLHAACKLAEATSSDSETDFRVVGGMDLYMQINFINPQTHQLIMHPLMCIISSFIVAWKITRTNTNIKSCMKRVRLRPLTPPKL